MFPLTGLFRRPSPGVVLVHWVPCLYLLARPFRGWGSTGIVMLGAGAGIVACREPGISFFPPLLAPPDGAGPTSGHRIRGFAPRGIIVLNQSFPGILDSRDDPSESILQLPGDLICFLAQAPGGPRGFPAPFLTIRLVPVATRAPFAPGVGVSAGVTRG